MTSVCTVTPQLMLPLVGDLAPAHRRATALSIVVSGLLLGMLVARLLSGVVAQFIGWRYIYWIAFALQYLILILLWLFMPDYPSTNPLHSWTELLQKYPGLLFDIVKMVCRHPILVQACIFGFLTSSIFTSFWTTLTFLLSSPPYNYTPLIIGLFALIGIVAMTWAPFFARAFMDKHHPLLSMIIGELFCLIGVVVGTYTGNITVAGPIIQALLVDIGLQTSQIANRTAIYGVEPKGRNRVNTAYMVSAFCGQLMGTAAGNRLYATGGWVMSGSASVAFICAALLICMLRGPHETGWFGWTGGWHMKKTASSSPPEKSRSADVEMQEEEVMTDTAGQKT
jgi:predicted MFS family arabinose efflux permease